MDKTAARLEDVPIHLQVTFATGSFAEKQKESGSECAQSDSGQGRPPALVGIRLRKPTGISGFSHLREDKVRLTRETHTNQPNLEEERFL